MRQPSEGTQRRMVDFLMKDIIPRILAKQEKEEAERRVAENKKTG